MAKKVASAAAVREMLEVDTADHPGTITILGVELDLEDGHDAALAAKWLDQLAGQLGTMVAGHA